MRLIKFITLSAALIALTACVQREDQSNQNGADQATETSGPCVGSLCLGTTEPNYLTNCSENFSTTDAVELKICSSGNAIKVAGATASIAALTVVNGKMARAKLSFDSSACDLVSSALHKSLGKSTLFHDHHDDYARLYESVGYPSGGVTGISMGNVQWLTANGRFAISRGDHSVINGSCVLYVDSLQAAQYLDSVIETTADDSIKG